MCIYTYIEFDYICGDTWVFLQLDLWCYSFMACFIHNNLPLLSSSFLQKSRQFAEATASAASPAGASTPANLAGHGLPGCCTGGRPRHNEVQITKIQTSRLKVLCFIFLYAFLGWMISNTAVVRAEKVMSHSHWMSWDGLNKWRGKTAVVWGYP